MLCAIGINHNRAPLEIREKLTWAGAAAEDALKAIYKLPGVSEAILVSTCSRTEIYLNTGAFFVMESLVSEAASKSGIPSGELTAILSFTKGREAAFHLFRVTAGLDSIIIGENQIQAQIKAALNMALAAKTTGPVLTQLFSQALRSGKKIRATTGINKGAASIAQAAIDIAYDFFGNFHGKSIMLIGAGKTGALAVAHLRKKGAENIIIANRTLNHAEDLARSCGAESILLDEMPKYIGRCSLFICSALCEPGLYLLNPSLFTDNSRRLIIDISLPRCASPELRRANGLTLVDLDDLRNIVCRNLDKRSDEKKACEAIITEECGKFIKNILSRNAVPAIACLKNSAEAKRQAELKRFCKHVSAEEKELLEKFSQALVASLIHAPVADMRSLAANGVSAEELLNKLALHGLCSYEDLPEDKTNLFDF